MCKSKGKRYLSRIILLAAVLVFCCMAGSRAFSDNETVEFTVPDTSRIEVHTNRYTQPETADGRVQALTTDGYVKMLWNDTLEVWFREECSGMRVVDRRSGYVWGSVDGDKVENLNENWSSFANSICSIEYFNEKNAEKRISLNDSGLKKDYQWNEDSMTCDVVGKKLGLRFSFSMILEEDSLVFQVNGTVEESKKARIKSLYFVPMFGSAMGSSVDGYMFVPDGCGALIRYQESASYISAFEKKIYGQDMGIDSLNVASDLSASRTNDYLVDDKQITFPVYGVVHGSGKNAVMTVVESGEEYASIVATPAGVSTEYNWVTARFDYRQIYTQPSGNGDVGVRVPMTGQNQMIPAIRMTFLTGEEADYAGMANRYRQTLIEDGVLRKERIDEQLPMRLNVIGAEVKKQFLFNRAEAFTTAEEAQEMVNVLADRGVTNVTMVFEGWQAGGLNGNSYGTTSFEKKLGAEKEFRNLKSSLEENNGRMYLQSNPVTATVDQISLIRQASITLSNTYAVFERANVNAMYYQRYVVKQNNVENYLKNLVKKQSDFPLSLDQYGFRLYADYTRNKSVTRSEALKNAQMFMEEWQDRTISLVVPNSYLWSYTDEYFDIPTLNSQYLYETDTVPFLQMVLKGSIDYYAPYANQGAYGESDVLKMIEYGAYPSFLVIAADNYNMKGTTLEDYYSLNFDDWKDVITEVYEKVSAALEMVEGAGIEDHTMLDDGVVRVDYDNGISIYINYGTEAYEADGYVIPAKGYLTERR